ncbi:polysaccharide pyruvyl transferase family protein [Halalkalicoccus subterraneus]|uniref:polysaccharide pyruvyl transferase family protein n=1 Tax=Halalkalicoccus subterraneus TaxID=2675002 RepID=UPI000EFDAA70|nr:polysaccharide pyruvyl transferase family protein [Halalkalicoccus subterraneus]
MPKIGILTFHNNENRGAILQSYCLQKSLSQIFSEDVEIVDYRTKSKEISRISKIFFPKHPQKTINQIKDRCIVNNFSSSSLSTSKKTITTDTHEEAVSWLEKQKYGLLFTGSDEIWKIAKDDSKIRSYLRPSRPFPNLYFLDPQISAMKVAYAASANKTNLETLTQSQQETMREHLSAYNYISVRDRHTQELLGDLGLKNVYKVPDPTLLVDIPEGDAKAILLKNNINLEKPILGYHGPSNKLGKEICDHYKGKGYQIIAPTTSKYADLELRGKVDPFEYYTMYKHFDMVVTSSLHSIIFSLKHRTPFVTLETDKAYANMESKTHSLLNDFSLLNRHIDAVNDDILDIGEKIDSFEQQMDDEQITKRTIELRNEGLEFIHKIKKNYERNN